MARGPTGRAFDAVSGAQVAPEFPPLPLPSDPLPDLTIASVEFDPATGSVSGTVENKGTDATIPSVTVKFYGTAGRWSNTLPDFPLEPLKSGGATSFSLQIPFNGPGDSDMFCSPGETSPAPMDCSIVPTGSYDLNVIVDNYYRIKEADETNNVFTQSITLQSAIELPPPPEPTAPLRVYLFDGITNSPIEWATVLVKDSAGILAGNPVPSPPGFYEFGELTIGTTYTIEVTAPGYKSLPGTLTTIQPLDQYGAPGSYFELGLLPDQSIPPIYIFQISKVADADGTATAHDFCKKKGGACIQVDWINSINSSCINGGWCGPNQPGGTVKTYGCGTGIASKTWDGSVKRVYCEISNLHHSAGRFTYFSVPIGKDPKSFCGDNGANCLAVDWLFKTGCTNNGWCERDKPGAVWMQFGCGTGSNDATNYKGSAVRVLCGQGPGLPEPLPEEHCGNGKLDGNEICDDGNTLSLDGCSSCKNDRLNLHLTLDDPAPSPSVVTFFDKSGKGNDATAWEANTRGGVVLGEPGAVGLAPFFDGINDYVWAKDSPSLDNLNEMTISLWFRPEQNVIGGTSEILDHYTSVNNVGAGYQLWFDNTAGNLKASIGSAPTLTISKTSSWEVGTWYHVAIVFRPGFIDTYVNNVLEKSLPVSITTTGDATEGLFIGRYSGGGDWFFNGGIDDVRIYNRALTHQEVTTVMNTPTPPPAPYS